MLWSAVKLALVALRRNPVRSILTVLGVVIGVAAVITMGTVGNGATLAVSRQIASLGSNLLMVRPGQRLGPAGAGRRPFTPTMSRRGSAAWRRSACWSAASAS